MGDSGASSANGPCAPSNTMSLDTCTSSQPSACASSASSPDACSMIAPKSSARVATAVCTTTRGRTRSSSRRVAARSSRSSASQAAPRLAGGGARCHVATTWVPARSSAATRAAPSSPVAPVTRTSACAVGSMAGQHGARPRAGQGAVGAPLDLGNGGGHTAAVRIIAGRFRGQGIAAPKGLATRPTSDRVREALFSILGDVEGLDVLDLFAGSGALGLEALSRGARSATFVDEARAALLALRANVEALAVGEETAIVPAGARAGLVRLARAGRRFGLVLADPPYAYAETPRVLADLVGLGLLVPGAWVVLEHAARGTPPAVETEPAEGPALAVRFTRTYGDTALTFYRWSNVEAE